MGAVFASDHFYTEVGRCVVRVDTASGLCYSRFMEIIGYQYALVEKSNGHVTGKVWDHPLWLQMMLARDERLARRCELLARPIYAGEWEKK